MAESISDTDEREAEQRFSEWTPEREILVAIFDRLGQMVSTSIALTGNHPPTLDRYPRPISSLEVGRINRHRRRHESLVKRLIPKT